MDFPMDFPSKKKTCFPPKIANLFASKGFGARPKGAPAVAFFLASEDFGILNGEIRHWRWMEMNWQFGWFWDGFGITSGLDVLHCWWLNHRKNGMKNHPTISLAGVNAFGDWKVIHKMRKLYGIVWFTCDSWLGFMMFDVEFCTPKMGS